MRCFAVLVRFTLCAVLLLAPLPVSHDQEKLANHLPYETEALSLRATSWLRAPAAVALPVVLCLLGGATPGMTQSPGRVPLLPAAPGETKQSRRSLKQAVRDATELLNKISDRIYEAVPQDDWAPPFDAIPSAVQQAIRLQMAPLETRIALEPLLDDAEKLMAELRKKAGARRGDREGEARALADSIEVMLVQRSGKTVPYSDGVRLFELRALERVPEDGLFEFNIWEPPARDGSRRGTAMQIAISEQGPEVIFSRPSIKTSPSTTFTKPRLREPAFQRGLRRAA